eukprot:m.264895 g.264895  ORF g.264895 m.264895 type:complete len:84 (+) comp58785_c0_seq1:1420-1671(+)
MVHRSFLCDLKWIAEASIATLVEPGPTCIVFIDIIVTIKYQKFKIISRSKSFFHPINAGKTVLIDNIVNICISLHLRRHDCLR